MEDLVVFDAFEGKRVLVTGHTGFKGSWLCSWLLSLGAEIRGVSIDIPTSPSLFESLDLAAHLDDKRLDVRDLQGLSTCVVDFQPEFVFHLAAQSLVSRSYQNPIETLSTNVIGTATVLEALRLLDYPGTAVMITSDKCYENVEQEAGYRETDHLGGTDLYSASKAAAEHVIHAYNTSFFDTGSPFSIASARAGNVIGGGDWAEDRIVPDYMRAWKLSRPLHIRRPEATRPWQHVLEPVSGYLTLASALAGGSCSGEAFNFGPARQEQRTVAELVKLLNAQVPDPIEVEFERTAKFPEAGLLQLNCEKAHRLLGWKATLTFEETAEMVAEWYICNESDPNDMYALTQRQIARFDELCRKRRGEHPL